MATTLSLCFSVDPQHHHNHHHHHHHYCLRQSPPAIFTPFTHNPRHSLLISPKFDRYNLIPSFSFSESPPSTTTEPTTSSSSIQDPLKSGRFLTNEELEKLKVLENFMYYQDLETGSLWVRVMKPDEMDATVGLLSESFAESMLLPTGYVSLLMFLVKQYLMERRGLVPHAATLVGFYRSNEDIEEDGDKEEGQLAGTVEVSFDNRGANASPPTPRPPKNSPYVCNMTVKKPLRRRGIGWHLLKASEELISQMTSSREVYLHCRMIDEAPFNMYRKAGYDVVNTDSIFILLTLQRRKHLMCKRLLVLENPSEMDISGPDEKQSS